MKIEFDDPIVYAHHSEHERVCIIYEAGRWHILAGAVQPVATVKDLAANRFHRIVLWRKCADFATEAGPKVVK